MNEPVIWGIHMNRLHDLAPIKQGYIAIGWAEVGDLSKISPNRNAFKGAITQAYPTAKRGAIPVWAGVLLRFATEMRLGDIIIFPSKPDRMVNMGRIVSDYSYDPKALYDDVNRRKVQWLKSIPRSDFSQSALNEIGSALTLFRVASNTDEFLAALAGEKFETEAVDEVSSGQVSHQVEESTEDFIIKRLKTSQTPYQFEHFIAHLLKCMGYFSRVTKVSGDGGIDIIAHRDELGFEPPMIKVQCKQTLLTIGRPDVQQLHGAIESGEHGLFVTLGTYTADARTFERGKPNLRLIDGPTLIEMIYNHYDRFEPRYQMLLPLKQAYIPGSIVPAAEERL